MSFFQFIPLPSSYLFRCLRRCVYLILAFLIFFLLPTSGVKAADRAQTIPQPDLLWYADHETGDFCQWQYRQGRAIYNTDERPEDDLEPKAEISLDIPGRTGAGPNHALKLSLPGATNGNKLGTRVFRRYLDDSPGENGQEMPLLLPDEAYYSAWYYFPKLYKPADWWNIFQFKSKGTSAQGLSSEPMFSFNIETNAEEQMSLFVNHKRVVASDKFPHGSAVQYRQQKPLPLPLREWVHIEAYLRKSTVTGNGTIRADGRLTIWQNGTRILDQKKIKTLLQPDARLHWSVNNYTDNITNIASDEAVTIYVDDAAISRRRLGPESHLPQQPPIAQTTEPAPDGVVAYADITSVVEPLVLLDNRISYRIPEQDEDKPAGRAVFPFHIEEDGAYYISGLVYAQDGHADSFLINVDEEPTIEQRWYFGKSSAFEYRRVSWADQNGPALFQLSAGDHQIVLHGFESCAQVAKFYIYPVDGGEQPGDRPPTEQPPADQPPVDPPPAEQPPTDPSPVEQSPAPAGGPQLSQSTSLRIEAEYGEIFPPFRVKYGSGGTIFVTQEESRSNLPEEMGQITIRFVVAEAGAYQLWARVAAIDNDADSFLVAIDEQPHPLFNRWNFGGTGNEFHWYSVHWLDEPAIFTLTRGEHLLIIRGREPNAQIDQILLQSAHSESPPDERPEPEVEQAFRIYIPAVRR